MNEAPEDESIRERVFNNILLLYLIKKTNAKGKIEDNLKLQKMVFLSQKKFIERKTKAFNYNFFRWHQGPFSAEVNNDLAYLISQSFISSWELIKLTKEGEEILKNCKELLETNHYILNVVNDIVDKFAIYTPDEIKNYVYAMKIFVPRLRKIMTIEEIPPRTLILFNPTEKRSKNKFILDESWCATLELAFDQEAVESLRHAFKDAIEGNADEFRPL